MMIVKRGELEGLAPHVDERWRMDLIGALVEVETHCRESGTSASEAFGPAGDYARALGLADESGPRLRRLDEAGRSS